MEPHVGLLSGVAALAGAGALVWTLQEPSADVAPARAAAAPTQRAAAVAPPPRVDADAAPSSTPGVATEDPKQLRERFDAMRWSNPAAARVGRARA